MANSLRAKIKQLRHKGKITQQEYDEIIKKLDGHDEELNGAWRDKIESVKVKLWNEKRGHQLKIKRLLDTDVPPFEEVDKRRGAVDALADAIKLIDEIISDTIRYTSTNGYTGVLYGESSLAILKDGKEVMHTGFRNINTYEELVECVDTYPEFTQKLADVWQDIYNDNDED